jgi:hypothetical protein
VAISEKHRFSTSKICFTPVYSRTKKRTYLIARDEWNTEPTGGESMNIFDGDVLEWDGKHKRSNIMHPRQVGKASAQWLRSWKLKDQMTMKSESQKIQPAQGSINSKRTLLGILLGTVLAISACAVSTPDNTANLSPEDKMLRHKYRGIYGGVLYFDASGYRKEYVTMYTQSGQMWRSELAIGRGAGQSSYTGSMYIPKAIRVIWRTGDVSGKLNSRGREDGTNFGYEGGTVLGDYTVPVIERIPDEVLDYIRKNGGALRLKIRLKDDGVSIGWDVEERVPIPNLKPGERAQNFIRYVLPGGDFREAQIFNGKVIDPGWQK